MNRRLTFALFLCLGASAVAQSFHEPPDVAALTPYSDYPVHIHILGVHWNHINGGYEGYGRADLLGTPVRGVDYTFSCSEPFLHNAEKKEFYQARWKKQDQKLEILMQKVGSDKLQKCELKTSLKAEPYGQYAATSTHAPATAPTPATEAKPSAPPPPQ